MPLQGDKIPWDSFTEVRSSTVRGYDPLAHLAKKLEEWDPNYVYGFCTEEGLPEWQTENWQHLEVAHFGNKSMKEFNESTALRYNLTEDKGKIKWRKLYVMYMARSYRERLEKNRQHITEERHKDRMLRDEEKVKQEVKAANPADPIGVDRVLEEQQLPADKFAR